VAKIFLVVVLLVMLLHLAISVFYSSVSSPKKISTAKIKQTVQTLQSNYDINRVDVKSNREWVISVDLYFEQELSNETVEHIFLDCATAFTDPEILTYINDNFYRYPFSIQINYYIRSGNNDYLVQGYQSLTDKGKDFEFWGYSNTVTGESYYLRLSEPDNKIFWN
jgi:hypothetical protein